MTMSEKYGRSQRTDFIEGRNGPVQSNPRPEIPQLEGYDARPSQERGLSESPSNESQTTIVPPPPPPKE